MGAIIRNIEFFYPHKKISNEDLSVIFPDYNFTKFEEKIGIKNRYWVNQSETAFDLAKQACEKLFQKVDRNIIDYILYCTQSPEFFLPTTACVLQNSLGLKKNIGALDFNLGCSGFVYGINIANGLIKIGAAKNILLVTAEAYSKYIHPQDRANKGLFGDAAAATLISHSEEDCIGEFLFGTDGSGFDKLIVKNGGARYPYDPSALEMNYGTNNTYSDNHLFMDGPEIFNFTSSVIPNFTQEVLEKNNILMDEIDQFILHQANSFMLESIRKKLNAPKEKFYIDLFDGGNTVSCTIPIALKKYIENNNSTHKSIIIIGFGVGLSWAGGFIKIKNIL